MRSELAWVLSRNFQIATVSRGLEMEGYWRSSWEWEWEYYGNLRNFWNPRCYVRYYWLLSNIYSRGRRSHYIYDDFDSWIHTKISYIETLLLPLFPSISIHKSPTFAYVGLPISHTLLPHDFTSKLRLKFLLFMLQHRQSIPSHPTRFLPALLMHQSSQRA